MTVRPIINIDKEKCNGCGLCVTACHENAIVMRDGKAELVSEMYCDGLGDCLAPCPAGAISIVQRESEPYDPEAVAERAKQLHHGNLTGHGAHHPHSGGCPSILAGPPEGGCPGMKAGLSETSSGAGVVNWPIQLALVPPAAPFLRGADLVLAAECTAFATPDFHRTLGSRPLIITCPKLYNREQNMEKLIQIVRNAQPARISVVRMEVPCCSALTAMVREAVAGAGTQMEEIIVGRSGEVIGPEPQNWSL